MFRKLVIASAKAIRRRRRPRNWHGLPAGWGRGVQLSRCAMSQPAYSSPE